MTDSGTRFAHYIISAATSVKETQSYYKQVMVVLKRMFSFICDTMTDSWNLQWLAVDNKKWSMTLLNSLVKHSNNGPQIMQAVKNHLQWIFNKETGIGSLCEGIVSVCSAGDTLRILSRIIDREDQLNWKNICFVIRATCSAFPDAVNLVLELASSILTSAVQDESQQKFITGLVIARQVTSNYCSWFSCTVSDQSSLIWVSSGSVKNGAQFVMDVLTHLVSEEPVTFIRAHLSSRCGVLQKNCQESW